MATDPQELPKWEYKAPDPHKKVHNELPALDGPLAVNLGDYRRVNVSNVDSSTTDKDDKHTNKGRAYFDLGLRHMLCYQHEMAAKYFIACLSFSPHCALAHGLIALCHSPNYNFKGDAYYNSTNHPEDEALSSSLSSLDVDPLSQSQIVAQDDVCFFPSQQIADRHSKLAIQKVEELRKIYRRRASLTKSNSGKKGGKKKGGGKKQYNSPVTSFSEESTSTNNGDDSPNNTATLKVPVPTVINEVETQILAAIRILTCNPGVDLDLSNETVGRPYADAMRKIYLKYKDDAEVAYFFAESLMVLNAWKLYEYPTGKPLSPDVQETRTVLERALETHTNHPGLCHMYVHLSEMSPDPGKALRACEPLRTQLPHAGHLIHMPTHIDVLLGDYESVVRYNYNAVMADNHNMMVSPETAGTLAFYFGYIVHNYHMLVYGCILGAMEQKGLELASKIREMLSESMFMENEDLACYLEAYSALDVHVLVRFGRWEAILELELPKNKHLMLYRSAALMYARGLAYANLGDLAMAKKEADRFDSLRKDPEASKRILHNNSVDHLLAVDAPMLRGEIAYHDQRYDDAFKLLRKAVELQDGLNFDEPWGKMQPIRHALGGLLLDQGHLEEAEEVFRTDLKFHPKNPWSLTGLIACLERKQGGNNAIPSCCDSSSAVSDETRAEIGKLQSLLEKQRKSEYADFNVTVPCACCKSS